MPSLVKIENSSSLVRDENTNAILNVDQKSLDMYKRSRKLRQQEKQQVVRLEEQVNSLMTDITEIKQLLTQLVRD
jgi:hypothetical protein